MSTTPPSLSSQIAELRTVIDRYMANAGFAGFSTEPVEVIDYKARYEELLKFLEENNISVLREVA